LRRQPTEKKTEESPFPCCGKGNSAIYRETEETARRRLNWLHGKLAKQGIAELYNKTVTDDLEKGYIRRLSPEEVEKLKAGPHFFLPHFRCYPS
jgi:hypothetical protein